MGQEIDTVRFKATDFQEYTRRLQRETDLLLEWARSGRLSRRGPVAGFELEACLVDEDFQPAPVNERFIQSMPDSGATTELARFNVELNIEPTLLMGRGLSCLETALTQTWSRAAAVAAGLGARLVSI